MLNKAVLEGEIESNPFLNVKQLPVDNIREKTLSFKEFNRLVTACPEYLKPIVTMAFFLPMRRNEILTLTWD